MINIVYIAEYKTAYNIYTGLYMDFLFFLV